MAEINHKLIENAARELRSVVGAEPNAPHASKWGTFAGMEVTLSRTGNRWALTLMGVQPLTDELAAAWAEAIGVAEPDWWKTHQGRRWRCDWQEGA